MFLLDTPSDVYDYFRRTIPIDDVRRVPTGRQPEVPREFVFLLIASRQNFPCPIISYLRRIQILVCTRRVPIRHFSATGSASGISFFPFYLRDFLCPSGCFVFDRSRLPTTGSATGIFVIRARSRARALLPTSSSATGRFPAASSSPVDRACEQLRKNYKKLRKIKNNTNKTTPGETAKQGALGGLSRTEFPTHVRQMPSPGGSAAMFTIVPSGDLLTVRCNCLPPSPPSSFASRTGRDVLVRVTLRSLAPPPTLCREEWGAT